MISQRFYALRVNIQDVELTRDGMVNLIYYVQQEMFRKPSYLFMSEEDIKVLATDASLGYIPGTLNTIMGTFLVSLPGIERGAIIAGFFA